MGEGPPLVALVAGPALERPCLGADRGAGCGSSGARREPDQAAGPGPGRLVAAVAGAVDADQLGEAARRVERRTAAAGAAQDDVLVSDADHVVDAEGAGRQEDGAAAGLADLAQRTVDGGRRVRGTVRDRTEVRTFARTGRGGSAGRRRRIRPWRRTGSAGGCTGWPGTPATGTALGQRRRRRHRRRVQWAPPLPARAPRPRPALLRPARWPPPPRRPGCPRSAFLCD